MRSTRDCNKLKMSYKGFEIEDQKDLIKCLFAIVTDYLGSIFHDKDDQKETIFHHLARGIPYTLEDDLKWKSGLGLVDSLRATDSSNEFASGERCQSSLSCVKILDSSVDSSFEELAISFDLTSLSFACNASENTSHVIFMETKPIYSLSMDILCKYIFYRTYPDRKSNEADHDRHQQSTVLTPSKYSETNHRIEIHRFPEAIDSPELAHSVVASLPLRQNSQQLTPNSNLPLLRSFTIPRSMLNVEIGQQYCLLYLDSDRSVLGRSEPFQFDYKLFNQTPDEDEDEDGFVIVES